MQDIIFFTLIVTCFKDSFVCSQLTLPGSNYQFSNMASAKAVHLKRRLGGNLGGGTLAWAEEAKKGLNSACHQTSTVHHVTAPTLNLQRA